MCELSDPEENGPHRRDLQLWRLWRLWLAGQSPRLRPEPGKSPGARRLGACDAACISVKSVWRCLAFLRGDSGHRSSCRCADCAGCAGAIAIRKRRRFGRQPLSPGGQWSNLVLAAWMRADQLRLSRRLSSAFVPGKWWSKTKTTFRRDRASNVMLVPNTPALPICLELCKRRKASKTQRFWNSRACSRH